MCRYLTDVPAPDTGSLSFMPREELEWWPEYGAALLWRAGSAVRLETLPLDGALRGRLEAWVSQYDDDRLPFDGVGDAEWVRQGQELLAEVRRALADTHFVAAEEPWWESGSGT